MSQILDNDMLDLRSNHTVNKCIRVMHSVNWPHYLWHALIDVDHETFHSNINLTNGTKINQPEKNQKCIDKEI